MADKNDTKTKLLDAAEGFIVQGGYNAFSFRDLAEAVGIKSASVHYHYPTKEDLVAAVMARYTELFSQLLPDPNDNVLDPKRLLKGFIDGFKAKIVDQKNMSICTVLASDKRLLPESVGRELAGFYQLKLNWLAQIFVRLGYTEGESALVQASQLLACLHGASILVQGTNQPDFFDRALSTWRQLSG
ncbi:TetR/AcrR family transcriptional regulator [Marinomonas sp. M1K-6]|uniref:TetR/AcrR family transcriptional regulator n=1 Tax=Marinomonas profundi TaxID=2726122 RepID=A0A847R3W3_9GAMM|nr:TetR/AcrR family transcriptional regulator [Marinomonas profundi]NLQ17083.1 TetR/AcrR family transcriptional regulator [Marinomonas profundi]UDV04719.1 TetR/AcrR family transcriptional regulator [Marinomonas profundi]